MKLFEENPSNRAYNRDNIVKKKEKKFLEEKHGFFSMK
jgi:hypothetical protein